MDIIGLFRMQRELDEHILEHGERNRHEAIKGKTLALLVEVGKTVTTTACLTSLESQSPSKQAETLTNYVDGLHYLLSIGIDLGVDRHFLCSQCCQSRKSEVEKFLDVYTKVVRFGQQPSITNYMDMMKNYLRLGDTLHFSTEEIEEAFINRNKQNILQHMFERHQEIV